MKIALLQEERYLPNYSGGNKCSRMLLEELSRLGHECLALCSVRLRGIEPEEFRQDMTGRGIDVHEVSPGLFRYEHRGVQVAGMPIRFDQRREFLISRIEEFQPDVLIVSADPRYYLLEIAIETAPDRVVFIAHSHEHVPFGPFSRRVDANQACLLEHARAVITVSRYGQEYLRRYGNLDAVHLQFPVYGEGPFPRLGWFNQGCVTLTNAAVEKGVDLFVDLARSFPDQEFAIVCWSGSPQKVAQLENLPNVHLLTPVDNIEDILRRTNIMLMPSIIPETFGLAAVEAMLRGIPVLASDIGGLPEAKLGVDYLLPVRPAEVRDGEFFCPPQDLAPWRKELGLLLSDRQTYERCSAQSRHAAARFVSSISAGPFEDLFHEIRPRGREGRANRRPVAVVDPFDAGFLLAEELQRRGYPCVSVESSEHLDGEILAKCNPDRFHAIVRHREDVEQTLDQLRSHGVQCLLHGCETGVMLADRLSEAMGFRSNGTALSDARRNKFLMATAARRSGLRVPDQCCSGKWEDVLAWVDRHGKWPVVAKPPHSLASEDVRVCRSERELAGAFHHILHRRNISGLVNETVLVQELLFGTQYVLDTVSQDGQHFLAGVWVYGRPEFAADVLRAAGGNGDWPAFLENVSWEEINYAAVGSNSKRILTGEGELAEVLFRYASRLLDALGIRHGPAHFELMWVDGEPLLVEVGARLHGAPSTHWMCRICTGTSQLEQTIDAYLNPSHFLRSARRSYRLQWHGYKYRLHPWRGGILKGFRGLDRIERLPSFRGFFYMAGPKQLTPKDCVGVVALIHPDEDVMLEDCQTIRALERQDLFDIEKLPEIVGGH